MKHSALDEDFVGHCRETTSPSVLQGTLRIDEGQFRATLTSFDGKEIAPRTGAFTIEGDDGCVYSMFDCYAHPIRWTGRHQIVTSEINANRVIVGASPWPADRRVSCIDFTFDGAERALMSFDHLEHKLDDASAQTGSPDATSSAPSTLRRGVQVTHYDRLQLFAFTDDGLRVSAWLGAHSVLSSMHPQTRFVPTIRIQFPTPHSVDEATDRVMDVVWFFSLSLGRQAAPRRIQIANALRDDGTTQWFHLRYRWDLATPGESDHAYFDRPIFSLGSSTETECMQTALAGWMHRASVWHSSYANVAASLRLNREFGRERLLAAFAWFESIPWPSAAGPITRDAASKLADAAVAAAEGLGLSGTKDLIRSALGKLAAPSLRDSLMACVPHLRERFGAELVPQSLEGDCAVAIKLRGKFSHGKVREVEFELLARSTQAIELVSLLSLLQETDLTTEARSRLRHHPLSTYLLPRTQAS